MCSGTDPEPLGGNLEHVLADVEVWRGAVTKQCVCAWQVLANVEESASVRGVYSG